MKIGVLGTGRMLDKIAPTMQKMEEIEMYAIASRTLEKAERRKEEYGFEKAYGSYEDLLNDPLVELVYIITPHSCHYDNMMDTLKHGKPVLCEKAFTMDAQQARNVWEYSKGHGIFVGEAIWTRYTPFQSIIKEIMDSGIVGDINFLTANLHYANFERERLRSLELGGGALLDVGVYGLNFASMTLGDDIVRTDISRIDLDTGVDAMDNITLIYADGRMACISCGMMSRSDRKGVLFGTKGYISVDNINNPVVISVYDSNDVLLKEYTVKEDFTGYEFELREAVASIKAGLTEPKSMPLSESVKIMEIMDQLRNK